MFEKCAHVGFLIVKPPAEGELGDGRHKIFVIGNATVTKATQGFQQLKSLAKGLIADVRACHRK